MKPWTSWVRLHPVALDPTLAEAVRARIADPLFLLGRQWQMGELRHDGGSAPIDVRIATSSAPVVVPDAPALPLEPAIEREEVQEFELVGLRLRRESGQQLVRRLRLAGLSDAVDAWVGRCPFPDPSAASDPEVAAWLADFAGKVPDAARVRGELAGVLPTLPEAEAVVVKAWADWDAQRYHSGAGRFDPRTLGYAATAVTATADGPVGLAASGHRGGDLRWHAWDSGAAAGPPQPVASATTFRVPSPLQFPGQPDARYWTFEEPAAALSSSLVARSNPSPVAALVLEFALFTGNDWFLATLQSPAGHAVGVGEVVVRDALGDEVASTMPGAPSQWRSDDPATGVDAPCGLPSTGLGPVLEGPELEAVSLVADEVGNLAWAVEERVPSPVDGARDLPFAVAPDGAPPGDVLAWRLAPEAPPRSWFPLMPVAGEPGVLVRGVHWGALDAVPASRLLAEVEGAGGVLRDAIPPEGLRITRRWQRARDPDGGVHGWIGRRVRSRHDLPPRAVIFDLVSGTAPPAEP